MINIRKNEERGKTDFGWLDSRHSFSFGRYYDHNHMGFGKLRVINEDWIKGGQGFGNHPHSDMEIITYVLEGALKHNDSMGNSSIIKERDFQKMSAGRGIVHSEYNASETEPVHLYQIWILPDKKGIEPNYSEFNIDEALKNGKLNLIASGSYESLIHLNQDVNIYISSLENGNSEEYEIKDSRVVWIQVTRGDISISGIKLTEGDGASIDGENIIEIRAENGGEVLLFDMGN